MEARMDRVEAEQTLAAIKRSRRETRRALNPVWYSNLVIGAFFVGAGLLDAVSAPAGVMNAYWVIGLVAGLGLIVRFYARVERELGIESRPLDASGGMFLALIGGVVAANVLLDGDLGAAGPLYVGAAGMLGFAWLWGDRVIAATAAAIALVATAVLAIGPSEPGAWANAGLGAALVVAGILGRRRELAGPGGLVGRSHGAGGSLVAPGSDARRA
jgi:hypothetical protein